MSTTSHIYKIPLSTLHIRYDTEEDQVQQHVSITKMASKALLAAGAKLLDLTRLDKLGMLFHTRCIDKRLDHIIKAIEEGNMAAIKWAAYRMKYNIAGLKLHQSNMIETIHYNEYLPSGSTATARALGIPEVLEMILGDVGFFDLMRCCFVSRMFRDVIEESKRLQEMLFLRPDPSVNHRSLLPLDFPSFAVGTSRTTFFRRRRIHIEMTKLPTALGTRWRKMFICNPPVKEIQVLVGFQRGASCNTHYYAPYFLSNSVGVTVGDLYDESRKHLGNPVLGEHVWVEFIARLDKMY